MSLPVKLLITSNILLLVIAGCLAVLVFRTRAENDVPRLTKAEFELLLSGKPVCRTPSGIKPAQVEP